MPRPVIVSGKNICIMKRTFLLLALLLHLLPVLAGQPVRRSKQPVRVACVGNSVTYGYGLADRAAESYPAQLQGLLGEGYEVRNFGHNGATLLRHGHNPYVKLPEYEAALGFAADIVIIHLGLNDTDPRNWPQYGDDFVADYHALIGAFRQANPKAKVWVCLMTPIFHDHRRFDSGTREWHALIQERIRQVAAGTGAGLINLYEPLHCHPDLFPDALHPDATGAAILARTVYGAVSGNYGGLRLPVTYGDGMVLQRQQPLALNGTANAGERVDVRFAGRKYAATAGPDGRWSVSLPAQEAGGPYELTFEAGGRRHAFKDVWVGEVWLCSGQSNMELRVRETDSAARDIAAASAATRLHFYNMPSIVPTYAQVWDEALLDSVNALQYVLPGRWERPTAQNVAGFSSIACNFGRHLADSLGCHVGIISNAVGGSTTEGWIDRGTLEEHLPAILRNWKENDHIMEWARSRAKYNIKKASNARQRHPYEPAYLFESAVMPLERYGLRGVLWYQGESNAHNVELHARLFGLLEQSWRTWWGRPDLPFYTVQLSSIATRPSWPHFRDSQRRLSRTLPHTWLTVSSDLGDSLDVHPRRKAPVADRLVRSALCHTYGRAVCPGGPEYEGMKAEGRRLRLRFSQAGGLRAAVAGEALRGFEVAGADGLFHAAAARVEGTEIVVESKEVKRPVAVRYAWQPYTTANLVNAEGLPASTFRDALAGEP